MRPAPILFILIAFLLMPDATAREIVILANANASVGIDLGGGSISDFRLTDSDLNPLTFDSWVYSDNPQDPPTPDPRAFGHFLCLDRWGPATEAEAANGMPIHGEASVVRWTATGHPAGTDAGASTLLSATLPLAGLEVSRDIALVGGQACLVATETVTNIRPLGRIYNLVQHPSICAPFLDTATLVDCNGTRGFMQSSPMPDPEIPEVRWPEGRNTDGSGVDLRRLDQAVAPWVVTFIIEEEYGWVTAASPAQGLLIGYLWPREDYAWFSLWSEIMEGKPFARGLEFGTTGLHRPEPDLLTKGRIFDRPLFRHIDAGESQTFRYAAFLVEIPPDYAGTAEVRSAGGVLTVRESGDRKRTFSLNTGDLFPASD